MVSKSIINVRYAETDKMGIVHHAVYPIWYEVARTDFIKKIGISYSDIEKLGIMMPLVELKCKYVSPAYYEDELTVEARIKQFNPVKIEFEYFVYRQNLDKHINVGSTLHAWVDNDFKIINLKKKYYDIYKLIEENNRHILMS